MLSPFQAIVGIAIHAAVHPPLTPPRTDSQRPLLYPTYPGGALCTLTRRRPAPGGGRQCHVSVVPRVGPWRGAAAVGTLALGGRA